MLKFEVQSTEVSVKTGVSRRGKPFEITEQIAKLALNGELRKVTIGLPRGQSPYAPGAYTIDPASFYVDGFGQLQMRLRLMPIATDARKAG